MGAPRRGAARAPAALPRRRRLRGRALRGVLARAAARVRAAGPAGGGVIGPRRARPTGRGGVAARGGRPHATGSACAPRTATTRPSSNAPPTSALQAPATERRAALAAAASLWGGEPLPQERYSDWAVAWRERLTDRYAEVLAALSDEHAAAGDHLAAADAARRFVELDPLHEGAHRRLIAAYARAGRRGHALRQFLACRARAGRRAGRRARRRDRGARSAASSPASRCEDRVSAHAYRRGRWQPRGGPTSCRSTRTSPRRRRGGRCATSATASRPRRPARPHPPLGGRIPG